MQKPNEEKILSREKMIKKAKDGKEKNSSINAIYIDEQTQKKIEEMIKKGIID